MKSTTKDPQKAQSILNLPRWPWRDLAPAAHESRIASFEATAKRVDFSAVRSAGEAVNVPNPHQENLEEGIKSCLRTIANADEGKEELVFSNCAGDAIQHAYSAGWDKVEIVDRLDNAGAAIGLDAYVRQRILSDGIQRAEGAETTGDILASMEQSERASTKTPLPLRTITPIVWKGTEPVEQRWLASGRIPAGDLTLYSGNGGSGKTETAVQLLVSVATGLGDWLGCVVESGPVLFLSCEEPEANVRDRVERICKHRGIDLMHLSPRCRARTRAGPPCQSPAMLNGRCRMHGGKAPGAPKGNRHAFKHGRYTTEAIAERRAFAALLRDMRDLVEQVDDGE